MRNFDRYVELGEKKIESNDKYDMQMSDCKNLVDKYNAGEIALFEVVRQSFLAGVEAGSRIERRDND